MIKRALKLNYLIPVLILAGFFVFVPALVAQAATRINTIEVYITQDTSTTENDSIASGAGVNDTAYQDSNDVVFNVKIPDVEDTVVFRNAYIEWRTFGETVAMTSGEMKFSRCTKGLTPPKAANCVATDTRTTNTTVTLGATGDADTAESAPILLMMNIPINSDTLATGSVDYFFNAQLTGSTRSGDNAKIVITYEYSDTAATQLTTVRYGVGCADPAADAEKTTLTAINPNIQEDGVEILSHWVEYSYMSDDASANDFLASSSFDGLESLPVVIDRANRSGHGFMILQEYASLSMDTLAERTSSHTIKLFSDIFGATANGIRNKCAEWAVTYLFDSSSATKTRTVAYFLGANDGVTTKEVVGQPAVYLPESSLTHRSVWVRYRLNTIAGSTLTSTVNITGGADTTTSQAVSVASNYVGGENRFIHNVTSYFSTNWNNGDVVLASISSDVALDAMAELFITSSFADSSATAIKTVYWFVGQDTAYNIENTPFETTFNTYVPETVSVASRSTGIIQNSIITSSPGARTGAVDIKVDSGEKAGQDDNVDWVCADDAEGMLCITGFSPSTQLTPQSAQTGVGASLSVNDVFTAGAYAYSTYEFRWSPAFTQNDFEWFVDNDNENVSEVWGNPDIAENGVLAVVPVTNDPIASGSEIRIRLNMTVSSLDLPASKFAFKLQYAASNDCPNASGWADVGAGGSGTIWRFATSGVTDATNLTALKISTSEILAKYVKSNPTGKNPNAVSVDQDMEWDFHVQHNGAAEAKTYCFRVVKSDGSLLDTYNTDGFPKLETLPGTGNLMRHGNLFIDEAEKGFFWAN